jgi:hypothetical protein
MADAAKVKPRTLLLIGALAAGGVYLWKRRSQSGTAPAAVSPAAGVSAASPASTVTSTYSYTPAATATTSPAPSPLPISIVPPRTMPPVHGRPSVARHTARRVSTRPASRPRASGPGGTLLTTSATPMSGTASPPPGLAKLPAGFQTTPIRFPVVRPDPNYAARNTALSALRGTFRRTAAKKRGAYRPPPHPRTGVLSRY